VIQLPGLQGRYFQLLYTRAREYSSQILFGSTMESEICVHIVKEWDTSELIGLYKAGGWWLQEHDPAHIPELVRGSYAFAVATEGDSGPPVGMGRVISDGITDAYIQDLVVVPRCRGRGVGRKIVQALLRFCFSHNVTWIALIAEPGTEDFYTGIGFVRMKDHVPLRFRGTV
jgi:ribosomal protein S18 acetylase RimI-like enzyme